MQSNFYETLAQGNVSEVLVTTYLANRGWSIEDKTKEKEYQSIEIDIIATKNDACRSIEIKQDNRVGETGNLLIETITNKKRGSIGWFNKTEADYIFIHNTKDHQLLIVVTDDLRAYLELEGNFSTYREWILFEGYGYKTSCGYTIPLSHFSTIFDVGIVDLEEEIA